MTKEEIESKTRFLKTTWSADYAKGTALKALSSLTEAYAEIERLKRRLCQVYCEGDAVHSTGCPVAESTT